MEPFLSEIYLFAFNFAPRGFALCDGQLIPINQNQALFSLLGTTYGGNGQTNFALPNLRGRAPAHMGNGYSLGTSIGSSSATITIQSLPTHSHPASKSLSSNYTPQAGLTASSGDPNGRLFAGNTDFPERFSNRFDEGLADQTQAGTQNSASVGGSQPHQNMMPYLVLNYCIALQGVFPSQN
ncbi:phage tail protein [Algoriphagus lacus]|uniref:Phage tail protein n=1 Tax=Algoriphagus lacus TaxID=2056311 RepID=A0A418PN31_9BACT|nr:tail fiber protein [Algoriphagus lacus]RIW12977.1 phage tail protein [Algoriphagus lacus]